MAKSYHDVANIYFNSNDYDNALLYNAKALNVRLHLSEEHPDLPASYINIGIIHKRMEEFEKAEFYYKKALDLQVRLLGENNKLVAQTYQNMGTLCFSKR